MGEFSKEVKKKSQARRCLETMAAVIRLGTNNDTHEATKHSK